MDRRTTIKWVVAASVTWPLAGRQTAAAALASSVPDANRAAPSPHSSHGYGTDPALVGAYTPGKIWPLTLTDTQRKLAGALSDLIMPEDEHSPSASAVGVVDFIDEWVSAPYPASQRDRPIVLDGFRWLDAEATRRSHGSFVQLSLPDQLGICNDICSESRAAPAWREPARFFALYRDLTAGGFYTTPAGRKDLGYVGNVARESFEGPPPALLRKLNLP